MTNMSAKPEGVVPFYHGRGTAEQWIKEGNYALHWTRLSCTRFVSNQVRLVSARAKPKSRFDKSKLENGVLEPLRELGLIEDEED